MRQGNTKILAWAMALILLSVAMLTGSMYALAELPVGEKAYDREAFVDQSLFHSGENTFPNVADPPSSVEGPLSQRELQEKFSAMYEIDEAAGSVTVISKAFLEEYWGGTAENSIRSLTTEEVYFLVADTIRLYDRYGEIILPAYTLPASLREVAHRFPETQGKTIKPVRDYLTAGGDLYTAMYDLYEIILYRLVVLSSPECFITALELKQFAPYDEYARGLMSDLVAYAPGYSSGTDRGDWMRFILKQSGVSAPIAGYFALYERSDEVPFVLYCTPWSLGPGAVDSAFPTKEMLGME